jgi:hypothetical protein
MTNNKQQTALEWLIENHFGGIENCTPDFRHKIEQAKEIQKDQHIKSWEAGLMKVDFNEYYEQTYGGSDK